MDNINNINNNKRVAVIIGNFAPVHNGHIDFLKYCENDFDDVIILIPGYNKRKTIKNPFDFELKKNWLTSIIPSLKVVPINDYNYNDDRWIKQIRLILDLLTNNNNDDNNINYTFLYTNPLKCSKYKELFSTISNWMVSLYVTPVVSFSIKSKDIRGYIFKDYNKPITISQTDIIEQNIVTLVPPLVCRDIKEFVQSEQYFILCEEKEYFQNEEKKFMNYPYPNTLKFNCADVVCKYKNYILLIKRKNNPGKNVWALPGGFVNTNETYKEAAIRELYEETGLKVIKSVLNKSYISNQIFDSPERNLGIPRITNAFYFDLSFNIKDNNKLPIINPMDDAVEVKWIPITKLKSMVLFDDHNDIIDCFLDKYKHEK